MEVKISPIGFLKTPFQEKFGVPRQSGMIGEAWGILKLNPDPDFKDAVRKLESFSHVWLIFQFHENANEPWRKLTTPPRTEVSERVGVFASRSPFHPNHLGMSVVKLGRIDVDAKEGIEIHVSGVDILDGTPVFDLKPYVPFVDSIPDAKGGFTESDIPKYRVSFSEHALLKLESLASQKELIIQMAELDPRPTSQKKSFPIEDENSEGMSFAFRVGELDVKWEVKKQGIYVTDIV
jgi:tRNA-Thr(GGU) m(6)t(6)A37 methyltransferase TsaA